MLAVGFRYLFMYRFYLKSFKAQPSRLAKRSSLRCVFHSQNTDRWAESYSAPTNNTIELWSSPSFEGGKTREIDGLGGG